MGESPQDLLTLAEQSEFRKTGRADEVEGLCAAFVRTWPEAVRSFEFGRSAEGRPMRALIVSRTGALSAEALRKGGIPLLMIQAGIHPGESDGKDAGFIALRGMLEGSLAPGALQRSAVLFVPAFNVDGHERFGRWNRPNQAGPEETGWRTTSQNLNLNRDYTKAEAPEMRAMLQLLGEWDPVLVADLHVTDGADFEPDVSLQVEPILAGGPTLGGAARKLRDALIGRLETQGSLPLSFYPIFVREDDPASGFSATVYSPRFSTGYIPLRNRFTVLVETHSWKAYAARVRVTCNTIVALAEHVALHGEELLRETKRADEAAVGLGGTEVPIDFSAAWKEPTSSAATSQPASGHEPTDASTMIEFRGYAYTREPSAISGNLAIRYHPGTPQIWRVPLRTRVVPTVVVAAPRAGYIVAAGYAQEIGRKLSLHAIAFDSLQAPIGGAPVQTFRARHAAFSAQPFEGRMRACLEGEWTTECRDVPANSLFVPIAQPRSHLVMALLEPRAPDSFAAWGFFNACFEKKEYVEPYVAEQLAREMLARDPALAAEFNRRLAEDPCFARDPAERLEFFCRRHPSHDEQFNLYPIYRVDQIVGNTAS